MTHASATAQMTGEPATDQVAGLSLLDELAEIGMTFARALGRIAQAAIDQAQGQPPEPTPQLSEAALAFSRVSRAVHMTIGLKARILRGERARADRTAAEQSAKDAAETPHLDDRRRTGRLRRAMTGYIVQTAIEAEEREEDEAERLVASLEARLAEIGEDALAFEDVDVKETAYAIARGLGIDPGPDWWAEAWQIETTPRSAGVSPASRAESPRSGKGGVTGVGDRSTNARPSTGPP